MPMTCPSRFSSGPPELPGLTAASTWIRPCSTVPVVGIWNERSSPETTPELMDPYRPNGLPTTNASLPTCMAAGFPSVAGTRPCGI